MSALTNFFYEILRFLHENVHVSWAWAIVLLTIIIRVVLIPLTWRQIKSMRAMQALQPHIKLLQEKYKDDRELLNRKMMEFYRENKVNPFGSCLPLLLQMPVFIILYYMLRNQGSVNGYVDAGAFASVWHSDPVSWLWISDITKFNLLLMFIYVGSQFGASWQMARKSAGQQRAIAFIMPVVVGIFMYMGKWPAGLMIYWFTSNLWSIAQQFVAERIMPVPAAAAAVLERDKAKGGRAKARAVASGSEGSKGGAQGSRTSAGSTAKGGAPQGASAGKTGGRPGTHPAQRSGGKSGGKRKRKKR